MRCPVLVQGCSVGEVYEIKKSAGSSDWPWSARRPMLRLNELHTIHRHFSSFTYLEAQHQSRRETEIILGESRVQRISETREEIIALIQTNGEMTVEFQIQSAAESHRVSG